MRTTIKSLQRMADEENANNTQLGWHMDWFDLLMYWLECGCTNMKAEFDSMSKKDTLRVVDEAVMHIDNGAYDTRDLMDLYKIAMTSLEERL